MIVDAESCCGDELNDMIPCGVAHTSEQTKTIRNDSSQTLK